MPIRVSIIYPYIASVGISLLKGLGIDVDFLDCPTKNIDRLGFEKLREYDWIIMEARTPTIKNTYSVAVHLRNQGIKVLLYGDHAMSFPSEALNYCDVVISCGDYDWGVYNFFKNGAETKYQFKFPLCDSLDALPQPDRIEVPYQEYYESWRHRDNFFWIMSQRGCPYDCTFCAWNRLYWQNRIRYRSPFNVAMEYDSLYNLYGQCEVLDDADCFDTNWGVKFARQLISRTLSHKEIFWAIQTHPNFINSLEDLRLLHKSGLRLVKLGVESGNQYTLNRIRKSVQIKQIERAIGLLRQADIQVHANLMVGFPWETRENAYHTIEWIKKCNPNQAQFSMVIPYPWTDLASECQSNSYYVLEAKNYDNYDARLPMLRMDGMTSEEVIQLYKDCWSKFYFNPKYIFNHLRGLRHLEGIKQIYRGYRSIRYGHMRSMGK